MAKRMIAMLLLVGVIFGGIFGFKAFVNQAINEFFDDMPPPTASITASQPMLDRWSLRLEAVGSFAPVQGADLTAEINGIVAAIHFENGAAIRQGQPMVSLDTGVDEAELQRLQAAEELARLELVRHERLFAQQSVSRAELEQRESEARQAAAAVRSQEARIRQKTIPAPFDGIAGIRRVNVGQYLSAGDPVVTLQSLDPIFLHFSLPENRLAEIGVGQPVEVTVDAYPAVRFTGEVTAIEPRVRESTRTFEVQATLANQQQLLRPGMFGRVRMNLGEAEQVMVLPQTAIRFSPYGNSVFVVREVDGGLLVTQRFVRTGRTQGDLIEILEGLERGERVATSGLLKLSNNSPVVINDDPSLQPSTEREPRPINR